MTVKWTDPIYVEWNEDTKVYYLRRKLAARQKLYAEWQRAERAFALFAVLIALAVAYLVSVLWGPLP